MGNFFRRLGDRFRNFMIGRYGTDSFGMFLVYALLVIIVISMFFRGGIVGTVLNLLTWVIFIYSWFRILSRNYAKRSAENRWYLEKTAAIRKFFRIKKRQQSERKEYKYFKCPECGQELRVPRGKGNIKITCRKCGKQFKGKT